MSTCDVDGMRAAYIATKGMASSEAMPAAQKRACTPTTELACNSFAQSLPKARGESNR